MRVADYHTYFVGPPEWGFSVWAHNACYVAKHRGNGRYGVYNNTTKEWVTDGGGQVRLFSKKAAQADATARTRLTSLSDNGFGQPYGTPLVIVKDGKWDYFFGRVKSNSHNEARSLQNLRDLETLGFREAQGGREQLFRLFEQGRTGPQTARHVTEHGITITRTVKVGDAGAIDVKYFYPGGNLRATPEISTIIPKIFKK